jgi:Mg-chelatase subunit ChlD
MSWPVKLFLFVGILLTFAFSILAQQPASDQRTRSLLANVLDRHGNAVRDLTQENFRIRINGKPASVVNASYSFAPRRIVVLLDMSGSMAGTRASTKWQIAQQAVEDLLEMSPADEQVALLTFSDQVHDVFDFSQTRSSMLEWLRQGIDRRKKVRGRTALFDATLAAAKILNPTRQGDVIYLVTDGGDNSSHISAANTKTVFFRSAIRMFVFLFAEPMLTEEERSGLDRVTELARDTGGFVFGTRGQELGAGYPTWHVMYNYDDLTREKIRIYTQALNLQVNGFYTLQIAGPAWEKDSKVKLEIVDKAGAIRKDVAFTYQRILPAGK